MCIRYLGLVLLLCFPGDLHGSSSSGSSERDVQTLPNFLVRICGRKPSVENGDFVESHEMLLKYQCNSFYSLVGPQEVVCYSNGTWSQVPTCKAVLKDVGVRYIKNGETEALGCEKLKPYWVTSHYAAAQCADGQLQLGECCGWLERNTDMCT